ncbi:MAG: RsmB/NOP family class I SAM-dependent RNA methyltransferase [Rhodospirillaceae bacterium]|nr:RsmB/NOP family class I SAM-dependent RNA methyltransferase [Rhodospirillaceae bacterium]
MTSPQHKPKPHTAPDARVAALSLLRGALRSRRAVDDGFDAATEGLDSRDRAFTRMLVATTLRRLGQIDDVLGRFIAHEPAALAQDSLRLGAAQALFLDTPAHAAVATTVELVKRSGQGRLAGLVNAVMRKVAGEGPTLVAAQDPGALNTPAWLRSRWVAAYGEDTAMAIARAHLVEPPLDLSAKDVAAAQALLPTAQVLPTGSLRVHHAGRIEELAGFATGAWWVQDAAATLPAKVLLGALAAATGGVADRRVFDLCAAPGGKTLQLAAAGAAVTAVDNAERRVRLLRENLARTGLAAESVVADVRAWQPADKAEAVLLDAPCSATGTVRRHPDLPYLKTAEDLARFPAVQGALLRAAANLVRPGGVLVYSVCALEPAEGEAVIDALLAERSDLVRAPIDPAWLGGEQGFLNSRGEVRTLPSHWPERGGLDGFFTTLIRVRP